MVVLQVLFLSPFRREPFLRLASLGQGAALDRRVIPQMSFILNPPLKTM
jgi:hypothetical protein